MKFLEDFVASQEAEMADAPHYIMREISDVNFTAVNDFLNDSNNAEMIRDSYDDPDPELVRRKEEGGPRTMVYNWTDDWTVKVFHSNGHEVANHLVFLRRRRPTV